MRPEATDKAPICAVFNCMKPSVVLLALLLAPVAVSQQRNAADYVRFLVPVLTGAPGANGADWEATLRLRNDGPLPLDAFPLGGDCFCCAQCLVIRDYPAFQANQDGYGERAGLPSPFGISVGGRPGAFLYVERAVANQFSAHLEIGDVSRTPAQLTTLPIPSETAFLRGRRSVSDVPIAPTGRITVRLYQLNPNAGAVVTMRVYEFGSHFDGPGQFEPGRLLGETVLAFQYDAQADRCPSPIVCPDVPYHPGYAQITNLLMSMPQVVNASNTTHRLRLEFEPASPSELYWPMITVTDNVTNAVQVFTVH